MSVTIEQPRRTHNRGAGAHPENRRNRDLPASAREAAAQRRARAQERSREQQRVLELLRRGAGVTQILRDIAQPKDRLAASLARAVQLRRTLDAVAAGSARVAGVRIDARDHARTVSYLDGEIRRLKDEAAQQKRRAAIRKAHRRKPRRASRRPAAAQRD
jgi:hypothetical protein